MPDLLFSREREPGQPWEAGETLFLSIGDDTFKGIATVIEDGLLRAASFPYMEATGAQVRLEVTFSTPETKTQETLS